MDKVFTNLEHAEWLREQARLKRPYWYGTYYNKCTEKLLQKKAKQYPAHYTESRMPTYRKHIKAGQICGDCVNGAIKGAVWSELGTREPKYGSHNCPDKSADGMFSYCKKIGMPWGEISTMPDKIGLAVRYKGHVGVYVGNGEVVEWRGFKYGCVLTKLKDRNWLHWYELPWTEYVSGNVQRPEEPATRPTLCWGDEGEAVKVLQRTLMAIGYKLPNYGDDGEFGTETEEAVKKFQSFNKLEVDGVVGPKTWAALDSGKARIVVVKGGNVNVRTAPNVDKGLILGVAYEGDVLPYGGVTAENGWHLVAYKNQNAWVSGKYGKLEG